MLEGGGNDGHSRAGFVSLGTYQNIMMSKYLSALSSELPVRPVRCEILNCYHIEVSEAYIEEGLDPG